MTKNEYMSRLRAALEPFSEATRRDVLDDYESHFAMGMESGRTEEEICHELGPIDLFIEELSQMEPLKTSRSASPVPPAAAAIPEALVTQAIPEASEAPTAPEAPEAPEAPAAPETPEAPEAPTAPETPEAPEAPTAPETPEAPEAPAAAAAHESSADSADYHCTDAKRLILEGLHAEVSITPSRDNMFHIFYEIEGTTRQKMQYRFYFREENGTIYTGIRKSKTFSGLLVSLTSPNIFLTAQVPAHMDEIRAFTVSGDMEIGNINPSVMKLTSTSGDITVNGPEVQQLEAGTTSGDIDISSVLSSFCKLSSVSGDIRIDGKTNSAEANTVSGDIELMTASDTTLQLNTVSGDISLCPHAGIQGTAGTVSGDLELDLNETHAGFHIDFSTVSGDLDIHRQCIARHFKRGGSIDIEGEGSHTLSISTTSGDISVR